MDFRCRAELPVPIAAAEGEASVFGEKSAETEIAGHANGGLHGVIRDHAGYDQSEMPRGAQAGFQIGADQGAVGPLGDDPFAGPWRGFGLEIVARLTGAVV